MELRVRHSPSGDPLLPTRHKLPLSPHEYHQIISPAEVRAYIMQSLLSEWTHQLARGRPSKWPFWRKLHIQTMTGGEKCHSLCQYGRPDFRPWLLWCGGYTSRHLGSWNSTLCHLSTWLLRQSSLQGLGAGSGWLSSLHSNRTGLSNECFGSSCCRFSLPFGESRSPLLPSGTILGIRKDQIMLKPQGRCHLVVIRSTSLIGNSWSPVNISFSLSPSQWHTSDEIILSHVPCSFCCIPPGQWAVSCLNSVWPRSQYGYFFKAGSEPVPQSTSSRSLPLRK